MTTPERKAAQQPHTGQSAGQLAGQVDDQVEDQGADQRADQVDDQRADQGADQGADEALAAFDRGLDGADGAALAGRVRRQESLAPFTTYRVGGPAARFVTVDTPAELAQLASLVANVGVAVLVVGRGSNLLVADSGFVGVAVQLGAGFADVDIDPVSEAGAIVRAGGGASLPVVARRSVAAGLTGFEWAVGVPGSIGGAVRMNAGGHGSDMAASLVRVRVVDLLLGEDGEVSASALELGYRRSAIASHQVVVRADLRLEQGDQAASERELAQIVRWRRDHQPGGPNAGSVFTNPPGDSAGNLIDSAGCKGLRVGSAEVSHKHANFIQADPGGSADDVFALMVEVQRRVLQASGITLHAETCLVGFGPAGTGPEPPGAVS